MLELAVLGLLLESPMHGYELRKRLTGLLGAFRAFSYGSLYPALRRMQLDVACLSEVDWYPDGPAVVRSLNDTAHLQQRSAGLSIYADEQGGRAGRAAAPRS